MILAIDTSAGQCAVALVGDKIALRAERMSRGHAEALFPMIEEVLAETGAHYADLTRIAVCTGPGSFTGIRVGVAAARGLALGCGIPAIGITRLEALGTGWTGSIVLKGSRGNLFVQAFDAGSPVTDPYITDELPEGGMTGDGTPVHGPEDGLVDPFVLCEMAAERAPGLPPAPLYLRGADADPPREAPPVMLD